MTGTLTTEYVLRGLSELTVYRIYYSDGSQYDEGDQGQPPARDIQVILQSDPEVGWTTHSGADYYIKRGQRWVGVDVFGLFDYLLDSGLVLFGRTISRAEFQEIYQRAKADKLLAIKHAYLPGERRP